MTKQFRPMLAGECKDMSELELPGLVSPKLDGIRCLRLPELGAVTRNLKRVPNEHIWMQVNKLHSAFPDGELIVGDPLKNDTWNVSTSGIMTRTGKPDFTFYVFDMVPVDYEPNISFKVRYNQVKALVAANHTRFPWLKLVEHRLVNSVKELKQYEEECVKKGFEGIMFRSLVGPYKYGRSTWDEQYLLKIKRWLTVEVTVIGFEEQMHNANEAKINKLGLTERSSHKANRIGKGTLGKFRVKVRRDKLTGPVQHDTPPVETLFSSLTTPSQSGKFVEFSVGTGTGWTAKFRAEVWANPKAYIGEKLRIKYQKLSPDGVPIFPIGEGFRRD